MAREAEQTHPCVKARIFIHSKRCYQRQLEEIKSVTEYKQGPTVHSTGSYSQYPVINHNGKEYKKESLNKQEGHTV